MTGQTLTKRNHDAVPIVMHGANGPNIGHSSGGLVGQLNELAAALDQDMAGVTIFDSAGILVYVNRAFSAAYGIELPTTIIGSRTPELLALLAPACRRESDAHACLVPSHTGGEEHIQQCIITLPTGRVLQIHHHPRPHGGWITRHTVAGDINSPSAFTNELISLQALIDQVPDYLWVKDTQSRFVVANLALTRDSGRDKSTEMIGLTDFDLHAPATAARFHQSEREIIRRGEAMIDEEEAIIDPNGREKWLSSSKIPLRNSNGDIVGLIGSARDITARKKAEALKRRTVELEEVSRQLAEALEREQQVNALQSQFVTMTSHEFRTPLAIIDGAAQRLVRRREAIDADFVAEKSQQIRIAVSRMVELMESILSFGKLESGNVDIRSEECSLRDILLICSERQQELSTSKSISLNLSALPQKIVADRSALEQVFTNLLSNAVKYSGSSHTIEVRGWCDGDQAMISVRDYGIGIDQDELPKMFTRYFRARTSSGIAGTGIGLNLVKHLVDLHGGRVTVESKKGEGSIFTVALPIAGRPQQNGTA